MPGLGRWDLTRRLNGKRNIIIKKMLLKQAKYSVPVINLYSANVENMVSS